MVWHGSIYIVPQDRSFRDTLYFFGQGDSVPRGLAVITPQYEVWVIVVGIVGRSLNTPRIEYKNRIEIKDVVNSKCII